MALGSYTLIKTAGKKTLYEIKRYRVVSTQP